MTRTVSIPVDSRANFTRAATVIEAADNHPNLKCDFIACSKFAYEWQCWTDRKPDAVLDTHEHSDSPLNMALGSCRLIESLAHHFSHSGPDVVIALTDRYETLAVAQTAALMNIPVAHIQGGELTGTIDESIRHAVTKLSHIHFPATDEAATLIKGLGENPEYVFNVGCPATDLLLRAGGLDVRLNPEPYILVLYHPVTTEHQESYKQMRAVLDGVKTAWDGVVVVVGPNHDAGNFGVWQAIKDAGVKAPSLVLHDEFVRLMAHAEVMVGNSSAGIREACYFGTPVVDVGSRQQNRVPRGRNTRWVPVNEDAIKWAIKDSSKAGRYAPEYLYGDGKAGKYIAQILNEIEIPDAQKRFYQ